jgi:glycosyltransferase involved in cell wall biosynthesis
VLLVHDVFPENLLAAHVIKSRNTFYDLVKYAFDRSYGRFDAVISIGRDMTDVIARKMPKNIERIVLIENWADISFIQPIPRDDSLILEMGLTGKVVIQYAGNIGRAQGLLDFADLIKAVDNPEIVYVFRGAGAFWEKLKERVRKYDHIILKGSYSRKEENRILASCDIALVTLQQNMYGLGVPSKTYNILAAGKPILFLGPKDSEIYQLINENDIGWAFDWSELSKLSLFIKSLSTQDLCEFKRRGANGRQLVAGLYNQQLQIAKFHNVFKSLQG